MRKKLFIIAGANGSGKTTLSKELLREEKELNFLNADDIAKKISPKNLERARISAAKELHKRLENLLKNRLPIAIETTLAGNNYIKTIEKAKNLDYHIAIIYSFVDNPQTCINRIKIRVLNGGHNIPKEDIIRRFTRSKNNFWHKYKNKVDEWLLYYNGEMQYSLVAEKNAGITILNDGLYKKFLEDVKK
jgi:predicted ABC-type ATPase